MPSSSRDLEVSGKPNAAFSCHSETSQNTFPKRDQSNKSGNRFESCVHSVFRFADQANIGKYLLHGNKDHLLYQARSELVNQEHQVESLNSCINELLLKDWNWRTKTTISTTKRIVLKEKAFRETQIRNIREM